MTFRLCLITVLYASSAFAQAALKENINWGNLSSAVPISEEQLVNSFQQEATSNLPQPNNIENNFEDQDFSFLNKIIDERVFFDFNAKVEILNKQIDRITNLQLNPDEVHHLKKYQIEIKSCAKTTINNVETTMAFLEMYKNGLEIFKGWVSSQYPHLNYPETPEYNIRLIDCKKENNIEK
jgi:hypothetical protein